MENTAPSARRQSAFGTQVSGGGWYDSNEAISSISRFLHRVVGGFGYENLESSRERNTLYTFQVVR